MVRMEISLRKIFKRRRVHGCALSAIRFRQGASVAARATPLPNLVIVYQANGLTGATMSTHGLWIVRLFFGAAAIALLVVFQGSAAEAQSPDQGINQGRALIEKGQFKEAVAVLEKVVKDCGPNLCAATASVNLGRAYYEMGEYDKAVDHLDRAAKAYARSSAVDAPYMRGVIAHIKGRILCDQNDYEKAMQEFNRAGDILSDGMQKAEEKHKSFYRSELAFLHANSARLHTDLYDYDAAWDALGKARELFGSVDASRLGELDKFQALILYQTQKYPEALDHYRNLMQYYEKRNNPKEQALILNDVGLIYENLSHFSEAQNRYERALKLARDAGDLSTEAKLLYHLAIVHYRRGNYAAARRDYQQSLALTKKLGQRRQEALTLVGLGQLERAEANYSSAMLTLKMALAIGDERGYRKVAADALEGMGFVSKDLGKFPQAEEQLKKALQLLRDIKDRRVEAITLLRLGNLYEHEGKFDEALTCYHQAASILEGIKDLLFLSETLAHTANSHARSGDFDLAEKMYEQAVRLRKQAGAPAGQLLCYFALVLIEKAVVGKSTDQGRDFERARQYLDDAAKGIKPDDKGNSMLSAFARGKLVLASDPKSAVALFRALKSGAEATGSLRFSFLANVGLGLALEAAGKPEEAEAPFEKAVDSAEEIRKTLDEESRVYFLDGEEIFGVKHVVPYEGLARVRWQRKDYLSSLEASERSKARSFSDNVERSIRQAFAVADKELADSLQGTEDAIRRNHEQLEKCRGVEGDGSLITALEEERRRLKGDADLVAERIRGKHPEYHTVMFARFNSVDSSALGPDDWSIVYEVTDPGTIIYLMRGKEVVKTAFQSTPRQKLDSMITQFRQPLNEVGSETESAKFDTKSLALAKRLFDALVAPVIADLPKDKPVTIIPDDRLGVLPFEMLVMNEGGQVVPGDRRPEVEGVEFFADRNAIKYYQSITALTLARGVKKNRQPGERYLVVADPVFKPDDERLTEAKKKEHKQLVATLPDKLMSISEGTNVKFDRLPRTSQLADTLKKMHPGKTDVYSGLEAGKSTVLKAQFGGYGSLVFATHGYFGNDIKGIREPVLVLAMIPGGPDDGFLKMSDVMRLRMNSALVVLLACQTGLGKQVAGEGVQSMGRGFQYAGAGSVLMSLWSVSEAASVELIERFFRLKNEGADNALALRLAKAEIRNRGYSHPFFWAPFILVGEKD
jgi:tetratricopeptide (TPR) repeat protein